MSSKLQIASGRATLAVEVVGSGDPVVFLHARNREPADTIERSRHVAMTVLNGSYHELTGAAHLPSLERPAEITDLVAEFVNRCSGRGG